MDETGQPGAATPGEHGDGTGQQDDDLARSASGWAPSAAGWSRAGGTAGSRREPALPQWRRPDQPGGWAASSSHHGDLPAPLPGLGGATEPPVRTNGQQRTNGVNHPAEEPPAGRRAPVSAPPGQAGEPRRDTEYDRSVPLQRPAPSVEQSSAPHHGMVDPDGGSVRHADEQSSADELPAAADPRGWPGANERFPPEPTPSPGDPAGADRRPATEPEWTGPNWNRPSWADSWAPSWSPESTEPVARRTREDRSAGWANPDPEPSRPYEGARPEPETSRSEPAAARPYERPRSRETGRPEPEARPAYGPPVPPAGESARSRTDQPSWAPTRPSSAPPVPPERSSAEAAEVRAARPFRLRPEPAEAGPASSAEVPGYPQTPIGSDSAAAPATSGAGRVDPAPHAPASAPPYAARRSAPDPVPADAPVAGDPQPDCPAAVLPQRVPAEPDVPTVPEPPGVGPPAETPELARIATHLRRDDEPAPLRERPEGFDVKAILGAVRGVAGVRDAELRQTPAGAHSLRLDLADGADPAEVSRQVARLLQERMGLAAAPQNVPGLPSTPAPSVRRRSAEARATTTPESRAVLQEGRATTTPESRAALQEGRAAGAAEVPRRRRQAPTHRGRASVEEPVDLPTATSAAPAGAVGTPYSGGQLIKTETAPSRPLNTGGTAGPRVVIDHVQVSTFGFDANVEVHLLAGGESAAGFSTGPAVDGYVLRLCAVAAAAAVDELLRGANRSSDRGRCFVEHAAIVPFGNCEVATVVILLVCGGWVEQLAGSVLVAGDPRQAVVRATLAAVNRRLEALLA